MEVLKDASATAIYGARGANGLVVITTKSGAKSEGKATLTFDSYVGVRTLAKRLDVLSVEEFVLADYERTLGDATDPEESMRSWQNRYGGFVDLHENYGNRKGIDWLDRTMGRTTVTQNYRVGINGGNDKLNYNMSYGYFRKRHRRWSVFWDWLPSQLPVAGKGLFHLLSEFAVLHHSSICRLSMFLQ